MTTRTFISPELDAQYPIFCHTLTPVDYSAGQIVLYTNASANEMQTAIEELARALNEDAENNQDIYIPVCNPAEMDEEQWIILGDGDAITNFWNNSTCKEVSAGEVLDIVYHDEFMQPFIMGPDTFYRYETNGETFYTIWQDVAQREADDPEDVEEEKGFLAYLSAPGYMDRTEPALYETYGEAAQALLEMRD